MHPHLSSKKLYVIANRLIKRALFSTLASVTLVACIHASLPQSVLVPLVATASPPPLPIVRELTAESLPSMVVSEREASISKNLPLLATLWAETGRIVDGRGTLDQSDDYLWEGREAILDRYRLAVFPSPPPPLTLPELAEAEVTVDDEHATLINGGDSWQFILVDGRWWLEELRYSSP